MADTCLGLPSLAAVAALAPLARRRELGPPVVLGTPAVTAPATAPIRQIAALFVSTVDKNVIATGPSAPPFKAGEGFSSSAFAGIPLIAPPCLACWGPTDVDMALYVPPASFVADGADETVVPIDVSVPSVRPPWAARPRRGLAVPARKLKGTAPERTAAASGDDAIQILWLCLALSVVAGTAQAKTAYAAPARPSSTVASVACPPAPSYFEH